MTDNEKIELIRQAMPAVRNKIYLNSGSVGPLSSITSEVIIQSVEAELHQGRADVKFFLQFMTDKATLRQAFADLVGATAEEIALTHHTTDGVNIVVHGLSWQPGDEIITTNCEHPGGLLPLYVLRQRYGVVVKVVDLLSDGPPALERLAAAITPRTRLIALSHVLWNTGDCLPLADMAALAHQHNVLLLVDGAQGAGVVPLDLPKMGVDFYTISGQKWLCGPEGTGALYIRREHFNIVSPTYVGFASMDYEAQHDWTGYYMPQKDARRYEIGTINRPAIKAMVTNLKWLQETVGWAWIYRRINEVAGYAHQKLTTTPGITFVSPSVPQTSLLVFNLDGYDPARVVVKLAEDNVVLRFISHPYALRIATGFFNTEADIDGLIAALRRIQDLDPESLPVYKR